MHELNLVDVQKRYREKDAVRGFTFTFTNGVYGLLGENGAGKTTLMRLICGILQPTNGSITCDNIRISDMGAEYRRLLGYLPQDFGYYGDFTAVRFLNYMAALKALPRDYAILKNGCDFVILLALWEKTGSCCCLPILYQILNISRIVS